ncbi:hypothetical protein [Arthrobacter sp. ISL-30]|uniref:hypothetical protein n=1 Tax=Arthrobacter sp. ISL-30 TaxID=2819109 RepID=UPI001BED0859|nr:hypothetical protein [Arthrobacter sp. ISL-30]MBT2514517.1 hypothetical protein [Arthrobacter sp. ISL-30]
MDIVLELFWLFWAAAAAVLIARWCGCENKAAAFTGFVLTPVILTGGMYIAGMTHLPGIAVALMAAAAALFRKYSAAGTLLAALTFLKIVMLPVAFLIVVAVLLLHRRWAGFVWAAAGFALAGGLIVLVLQVRGELLPYLRSLVINVSYSQGTLGASGLHPAVEHLLRVVSLPFLLTFTTFSVTFIMLLRARRKAQQAAIQSEETRTLLVCEVVAFSAGLAVLGITGMWGHHGQVLYLAAVLLAVDAVLYLQTAALGRPAAMAAGALCFALLLSGPVGPEKYYDSVLSAERSVTALAEPSSEAQALLAIAPSGNYARVGQNFDGGHAYGLEEWKLACPRFHQYPFDSRHLLQEAANCLPEADVILIDASAEPLPGKEAWNEYLERVHALLVMKYLCSHGEERICIRQTV